MTEPTRKRIVVGVDGPTGCCSIGKSGFFIIASGPVAVVRDVAEGYRRRARDE
jgi:hypothetical protein